MSTTETDRLHTPPNWPLGRCPIWAVALLAVASGATVCQAVDDVAPSGAEPAPRQSVQPADSWPWFRGNPQATGASAATLPQSPELLWKFRVKQGAFETTPAIADGVVYLGDLDGKLFALRLADGKQLWVKDYKVGYMAAPAVKDGRLYLGDIDGGFHCYNVKDGSEIWKIDAEAEIDSSANFYKDRVLFGSQDATLYCLDFNGKLVWKHAIEDQIRCSPTIVESRCFVAGCDSRLHVIDLDKGVKINDIEVGAPTGATPAVVGDFAYFGTEAGELLSVDWRRGQVAWRFIADNRSLPIRSSAAVADGLVVVGSRDKRLYALKAADGKRAWTYLAKHRIDSSPVIVGKRAFVGSADGRVQAVSLADGKADWTYEAGGSFSGSPAVVQGRLVIASDDGVVYCFGAKN